MHSVTGAVVAMVMAMTVIAGTAAEIGSANYMLPACKDALDALDAPGRNRPRPSPTGALERGLCIGRVIGIVDALNINKVIAFSADSNHATKQDLLFACADMPKDVTYPQIIRVVVAYIEARPNRMHESFGLLAVEALRDAWPCSK